MFWRDYVSQHERVSQDGRIWHREYVDVFVMWRQCTIDKIDSCSVALLLKRSSGIFLLCVVLLFPLNLFWKTEKVRGFSFCCCYVRTTVIKKNVVLLFGYACRIFF